MLRAGSTCCSTSPRASRGGARARDDAAVDAALELDAAAARADAAAAGPAADDGEDDAEALERVRKRLEDSRKSNAALATSVLQMIGPYNWVACQNCGHRNNSGTRCLQCGHSIEFDVME